MPRIEEKWRTKFNHEIDEVRRKYEQSMEKQEEKMKQDLQLIDKVSVEKKLAQENEKQKVSERFQRHWISDIKAVFTVRIIART